MRKFDFALEDFAKWVDTDRSCLQAQVFLQSAVKEARKYGQVKKEIMESECDLHASSTSNFDLKIHRTVLDLCTFR